MRFSPGSESLLSRDAGSSSSAFGSPRRYRPCDQTSPGSRAAIFAINSATSRSVRKAWIWRAGIRRTIAYRSFDHDRQCVHLALVGADQHLEFTAPHELPVEAGTVRLGAARQAPLHAVRFALGRAQ